MRNYLTKYPGFLHGGDYNLEQWMDYPEVLEQDIEYMKAAHCNAMTIGIFSWSYLEPEEGKYQFAYLDKIIDNLTTNGIKIILSTPSGARPRWLAQKYPEVLRVDKDNRKQLYGERHNHCYTSPVYREKTANIDRILAQRYADNENIILWHISNEYGGECHCELCQAAFREWLKQKYNHDLKKLNHAWWTGFWSHTVTDWEQIHSPVHTGEKDVILPGLFLDWKHFVTYQTTEFMKTEIEAVKSVNPNIPVTTNMMGAYQPLDYHYMKNFLDVISWDAYPKWHSDKEDTVIGCSIGFEHDLHRCLKQKPFLLMESTPSLTNWFPYNKLKRPNMHRLSSLQAVAHGSDSVQYFQWRKGRGGSEKFHGAVIDHNGKAEGRVFEDVKALGIALEKLQNIVGTPVKSDVALVYEFKNRWAVENASGFQNEDKKYKRTCINHYAEFWKRGVNVDVIGINSDLSGYKILILPMLYSLSEEEIDRIEEFAANGGTVVATYMTGYVNETDLCYLGGFPGGKLKEIFGITADEIDTLYEGQENSVEMGGIHYKAVDYCELITNLTAETIGIFESDFYAGKPAVLKNRYKKGTLYYIGFRDTGELLSDLYEMILRQSNVPFYDLPEGVTIHSRENYVFVENYTQKPQTVLLSGEYTEEETGDKWKDKIELEPYGIKVLMKENSYADV